MQSTFLWQANLKSTMMNIANLRTISVSQLTSTFNFHFYAPRKVSSIYLASEMQALISVMLATVIVYPQCFAVLLSVSPMLLRKTTGSGRSISDTFSTPNDSANTLVQQKSKQASVFFTKVIRHRRSSGTNHGMINK